MERNEDGTADPIIRIRGSLKKLLNAYDKELDFVFFVAEHKSERKNQRQKTIDPYLNQSEWQPSPEGASLSG
jgi:hypothetical protein